MNYLGSFPSMDQAYPILVSRVVKDGERLSPRGMVSIEMRPASFTITDPTRAVYTGEKRKMSYRFLAVETLSYLAGLGDEKTAKLLVAVNKNLDPYLNKLTMKFDGAYGPRLRQSLPAVVALLDRDRDSRQAVAAIWSPGIPESIDVPCTVSLHFYVAHDKLEMTAYMRSNDLMWGTPYDVAAFCILQQAVAKSLGLQVGAYHHVADSLHVYQERVPDVKDDKTIDLPFEPFKKMVCESMHPSSIIRHMMDDSADLIKQIYRFLNLDSIDGPPKTASHLRFLFGQSKDPVENAWVRMLNGKWL